MAAGTFSFSRFYARRAKRILPPLFTVLAFSSVVAIAFLSPSELRTYAGNCAATVFSVSNIVFARTADYFASSTELNPLLMTWSLGVEEQFYIFFPILLIAIRHRAPQTQATLIGAIALVSLLLSVWATKHYPSLAFYLLPTRAWELGAGILLFLFENRGRPRPRQLFLNMLSVAGAVLICYPVLAFTKTTPFPGVGALSPVLGAVLLIYSREGWVNRFLSSRPMVGIGLVSYSWYLWHWPLLSFARTFADRDIPMSTALSLCAISLIFAVLTYRIIESRFRRSRSAPGPLLLRYLVGSMIFVVFAALIIVGRGFPSRFGAALTAVEADVKRLATDTCLVGYGKTRLSTNTACRETHGSAPAVAVFGDSHAAAVAAAIRSRSQESGQGFVQLTKSSCPPLTGVSRYMQIHPRHFQECLTFNQNAIDAIAKDSSIKTVMLGAYWSVPFYEGSYQRPGQDGANISPEQNRENFILGLKQTILALRGSGKRIVILQDAPYLAVDPVRSEFAQLIPGRHALGALFSNSDMDPRLGVDRRQATSKDSEVDRIILEQIMGVGGVSSYNLKDGLCDAETCRIVEGNTVFYVDRQHLSLAGAMRATGSLNW